MTAALNNPATGTVTNQATKMFRKRRQSTAFRERIQPTATTEPTYRSTDIVKEKEADKFKGETQKSTFNPCKLATLKYTTLQSYQLFPLNLLTFKNHLDFYV